MKIFECQANSDIPPGHSLYSKILSAGSLLSMIKLKGIFSFLFDRKLSDLDLVL